MFAIVYGLILASAAPAGSVSTGRPVSPCPASVRLPSRAGSAALSYRPLDHVVLYHGPPAQEAELRPSDGWRRGAVIVEIHRSLNEAGVGLKPSDTWLVCHYGSVDTYRIVKALGTTFKQCIARYRRTGENGSLLQSFTCTA